MSPDVLLVVMSVWKENQTATEEKTEGRKILKQRNMENILINERHVVGRNGGGGGKSNSHYNQSKRWNIALLGNFRHKPTVNFNQSNNFQTIHLPSLIMSKFVTVL